MRTLGQQVRDYREEKGLKTGDLAKLVKTSRQNIESLENAGNRIPKYLGALAAVMGTTVDRMMAEAGMRPPLPISSETREVPEENVFEALTEAERDLLTDFRVLPDEDQLEIAADIQHRALKARAFLQKHMRRFDPPLEQKTPAADKVLIAARPKSIPVKKSHRRTA